MSQHEPNPKKSFQGKSSESQPSVPQTQISSTKIDWQASVIAVVRSTRETIDRVMTVVKAEPQSGNPLTKVKNVLIVLWQAFLPVWAKLIAWIRTRLPQAVNQKLNDRLLSGIVAGVLVILFWFTTSLFSAKPVQPTIAQRPAIERPSQPNEAFPTDLTAPDSEAGATESAPEAPAQNSLIAVEREVLAVSDQFIQGLVLSVQPNFERGRLVVNVSPDWFRFNREQQDRFANELWQRSQPMNFTRLEIRDPEGQLLARNPIVGTAMVILQRKQLPEMA